MNHLLNFQLQKDVCQKAHGFYKPVVETLLIIGKDTSAAHSFGILKKLAEQQLLLVLLILLSGLYHVATKEKEKGPSWE